MDGPNVNLKFHRILEEDPQKSFDKKNLNVGTCSLHPVRTSFANELKKLNFDFDRLATDLHFVFKYSSARREDYKFCNLESDLEATYMVKHVSTPVC